MNADGEDNVKSLADEVVRMEKRMSNLADEAVWMERDTICRGISPREWLCSYFFLL